MAALFLLSAFLFAGNGGLLVNGDFSSGLESWTRQAPPEIRIESGGEAGSTVARFVIPPEGPVGYPLLYQEVPTTPGTLIEGAVDAMAMDAVGYGPYASVDFYNADGVRISFTQSDGAVPQRTWVPLRIRATAPPDTAAVRFNLVFNGTGVGVFRNAFLRVGGAAETPRLEEPVTITVTDERPCAYFKGFGAEDDGWFYNERNREQGIDEGDIKLREDRIRWMDPDWQRMFFWCKDWNPSSDWETFDFDTPNMRSHYRALDLYQEIGAVVNVVGVEWSFRNTFREVEQAARAIATLLEHLIRTKGYSCVQEWTLTNEPNGRLDYLGVTFEDFVRLHVLVKEETARRGLQVRVIGSDDTNGLAFFSACVTDTEYHAAADIFASHRYLPFADRNLMAFFVDDRLRLLELHPPRKPFVVAEFGFQDARSGTFENPLMETYPYAVWTQAFVIDGLNRGVAGFSIWCMHEVYYPFGSMMNYGLWNYKNRNWDVRPVYHSWAGFCRLTEPGDPVYRCDSSSPTHVLASRVGDTVFWVNRCDQPARVQFKRAQPAEIRVMTESNLSGERECGETAAPADNGFTAPPQSFGYARLIP